MDDHSAVLIIRVWVEDGTDSFRGRLTAMESGEDGGTEDNPYAVASSSSDVLDAVREWLGSFERGVSNRIDRY